MKELMEGSDEDKEKKIFLQSRIDGNDMWTVWFFPVISQFTVAVSGNTDMDFVLAKPLLEMPPRVFRKVVFQYFDRHFTNLKEFLHKIPIASAEKYS